MSQPCRIVTVGHAIVDVLAPSSDSLIERFGLQKGTMTLVEDRLAAEIYRALGPATEVSGGAAANTAACLASLGTPVRFLGKTRDDELGRVFSHDIRAAGVAFDVTPAPAGKGPGTGRCLVMVSPDAEKTMCTSLGVGAELHPSDLDEEAIAAAEVLYLEGYLYGMGPTDKTVEVAIEMAKRSGTKVALSLADPSWVQLHARHFEGILDSVDILFANEWEACLMAHCSPGQVDEALSRLVCRSPVVLVTLGARGSKVAWGEEVVFVPAVTPEQVVDTTGAGDSYAAGFLFGLLSGFPPSRCAELGSLVASEIVSHLGARPERDLAELASRAGLLTAG